MYDLPQASAHTSDEQDKPRFDTLPQVTDMYFGKKKTADVHEIQKRTTDLSSIDVLKPSRVREQVV